jgi:hypothetical protein
MRARDAGGERGKKKMAILGAVYGIALHARTLRAGARGAVCRRQRTAEPVASQAVGQSRAPASGATLPTPPRPRPRRSSPGSRSRMPGAIPDRTTPPSRSSTGRPPWGMRPACTSWLFHHLAQHAQIGFPAGKEIYFWEQPGDRTLAWYESLFADGPWS